MISRKLCAFFRGLWIIIVTMHGTIIKLVNVILVDFLLGETFYSLATTFWVYITCYLIDV